MSPKKEVGNNKKRNAKKETQTQKGSVKKVTKTKTTEKNGKRSKIPKKSATQEIGKHVNNVKFDEQDQMSDDEADSIHSDQGRYYYFHRIMLEYSFHSK